MNLVDRTLCLGDRFVFTSYSHAQAIRENKIQGLQELHDFAIKIDNIPILWNVFKVKDNHLEVVTANGVSLEIFLVTGKGTAVCSPESEIFNFSLVRKDNSHHEFIC